MKKGGDVMRRKMTYLQALFIATLELMHKVS